MEWFSEFLNCSFIFGRFTFTFYLAY